MSEGYEIRWAHWDGFDESQLDEIVGVGRLHTEDLSGSIMLMFETDSGTVHAEVRLQRLPMSYWWQEIKDAWQERRLPCFWEPRQVLIDEYGGGQ